MMSITSIAMKGEMIINFLSYQTILYGFVYVSSSKLIRIPDISMGVWIFEVGAYALLLSFHLHIDMRPVFHIDVVNFGQQL